MSEAENIPLWSTQQVLQWFQGLNECLASYRRNLMLSEINGAQLIALNYEDLENLYITSIGHQELILESTALLRQLHYEINSENLQSHAMEVNTKCRELNSEILASQSNDEFFGTSSLKSGTPASWLRLSADVLDASKALVMWLDRIPFCNRSNYKQIRNTIVKLSVELSVTMQQNVFLCVIQDATLNICNELRSATDRIIQSSDVMTIQPASLEQVSLLNSEAGLGLFIKATFDGHHVITGTKDGSISSKIRRIVPGDEVVSVNGQTVIGWQLPKLVNKLKEDVNEVILVLKKRPFFAQTSMSSVPMTNKTRMKRYPKAPPTVAQINKATLERLNDSSSSRESSKRRSYSDSFNDKMEQRHSIHHQHNHPTSSSNSMNRVLNDLQNSTQRLSIHSAESSSRGSLQSAKSSIKSSGAERTPPMEQKSRRSREYLSLNSDATMPSRSQKNPEPVKSQEPPPSHQRSNNSLHSYMSLTHSSRPPVTDPSSSPLDLFSLPPPPNEPYSPRKEHAIPEMTGNNRNSFNLESLAPPTGNESPNSQLDIEHKRRFTVIGGENFDEKWFEDFMARVNQDKQLQAQCKASDDNVFEPNKYVERKSINRTTDDNIREQIVHPHTSGARSRSHHPNRPVSMPPNYYSDSQLKQLRKRSREGRHMNNRILTTIPDESAMPLDEQQVDVSNKKQRHLKRHSSYNSNQNNNVKSTPPPPRSTSIDELNNYDAKHKRNSVRQSLVEFVKEKRFSQSEAAEPATEISSERKYHTPERPSISSNLDKINPKPKIHRNIKTDTPQGERIKLDYVSDIPNLTPNKAPDKAAKPKKSRNKSETKFKQKPVPKPRSRSYANIPLKNSPPTIVVTDDNLQNVRSKSMENLEPVRLKHKKKTAVDSLKCSPNSSRGSYLAAIEGGYDIPKKSKKKMKKHSSSSSITSQSSSTNVPIDTKAYEVKVINGVLVRIRKSATTALIGDTSNTTKAGNKVELLKYSEMPSNRRISCRDLGDGECNGWLWKKKIVATSALSSKWSKRWVVLKKDGLYCYRHPEDERAESYMQVLGYEIRPSAESKRKFAFCCTHPKRKTFYFASESQIDMGRWMNKMGLAAIGYKDELDTSSMSPKRYYSESENDDSFNSPSSSNRSSSADNGLNISPEKKSFTPHAKSGLSFNMKAVNDKKKLAAKLRIENEHRGEKPVPAKRYSLPADSNKIINIKNSPDVNGNKQSNKESSKPNKEIKHISKSLESLTDRTSGTSFMESLESIEKQKLHDNTKTNKPLTKTKSSPNKKSVAVVKSNHELKRYQSAGNAEKKTHSSSPSLQSKVLPVKPNNTNEINPMSQLAKVIHPDNSTNTNEATSPTSPVDSSIDEMSKAIQHAELDITGIDRRVTLRRKMTVLSRDPAKNKLLLRQRGLKRQLKALQIDLEYFNDLLDKPKVTSDLLNSWLTRHESLLADINSIRRLSRRKKLKQTENENNEANELSNGNEEVIEDEELYEVVEEQIVSEDSRVELQETSFVGDDEVTTVTSNVRPRSGAFSIKQNPLLSLPPNNVININNNNSVTTKSYLETDL